MRACIYTRVSNDPHQLGRSVSEQEAECRALCEKSGWEVVQVFSDTDRSASRYAKRQRPAYKKVRDFVAAGECDVLVTWECSRAQRDLEDYVQLRELCRRTGVMWSYSGRTYDLSRTDDRFITGLDALLAERESDVTRDRILRDMRANAVKGRPHGRLPYGYQREYDPTTGELIRQVIKEDEAQIIREAAERFLAGESTYGIARDFQKRGVFGVWDPSRIARLLKNPTYIAQRKHQGVVIGPADWEPILDEAIYYQCVAKLSDPSRKTTDEHHVKYLLSGIAMCGICGRKMKVMPQNGGRRKGMDRYRYKTYICKSFCTSRKVEWVDDLITKLVIARLSRPDALALLSLPDEPNDALDTARAKRARLESFYDAAAKGEISAAALARIEAQLLPEVEALEAQVKRYDVPSVVYELVDTPDRWKALTLAQKRDVIHSLMEIRIHPSQTKKGSRVFDVDTIDVTWRRPAGSDVPALRRTQEQAQAAS